MNIVSDLCSVDDVYEFGIFPYFHSVWEAREQQQQTAKFEVLINLQIWLHVHMIMGFLLIFSFSSFKKVYHKQFSLFSFTFFYQCIKMHTYQ